MLALLTLIPMIPVGGTVTLTVKHWLFSVSGTTYSAVKPSTGQSFSNTNPSTLINSVLSAAIDGDVLDFQVTHMIFTTNCCNQITTVKSLTWINGFFEAGSVAGKWFFAGPGDGLTTLTMRDFTFNVTLSTSAASDPGIFIGLTSGFLSAGWQAPFMENIRMISNGLVASESRFFVQNNVFPRILSFDSEFVCENVLQDSVLQIADLAYVDEVSINCQDGLSTAIRLFNGGYYKNILVQGALVGFWNSGSSTGAPLLLSNYQAGAGSVATAIKEDAGQTGFFIDGSTFNGQTVTVNKDTLITRSDINPKGPATITVGASPFTYQNGDNVYEYVNIFGGAFTTVTIGGVNFCTGAVTDYCTVALYPAQSVIVTYTAAPTMVKNQF